jgi:hypothetical protein
MRLDPAALEGAVRRWTTEGLGLSDDEETLQAVSIDGKTLCATLRSFASAVHLLAAVDHQTGCVLSQCRVSDKTNEHKAALELLRSMVLKGSVVVGDSIFCQRGLCQEVVAAEGDFFVAVKENQPTLLRGIEHEFAALDAAFSPLRAARTTV